MRKEDAKKQGDKGSSGGKTNNIVILLLLTSILAHGILFSSRTIEPLNAGRYTIISHNIDAEDYATGYASGNTQQQLRESSHQKGETIPRKLEQLPHWRLATDCSLFSFDCFATAQREKTYMPYPFNASMRANVESPQKTPLNGQWSVESFDSIPSEWIKYLNRNQSKTPVLDRNYLYPPMVEEKESRACLDLAINQNKSTIEQLDILLSGKSPQLTPEPDTNMVAFTISDFSYVEDMIHEVFQMMDDVVGFSSKHFFMVAIDKKSAAMACNYGYSVVLWKADEDLKDAVANTKLAISLDLVKRGIDFFFSEMDVWWIRSPKAKLVEFQSRHKVENGDKQNVYFSGHQNNYGAPNIGVYAVNANKYSEEYFRMCLDIVKESPETHDQHVMAEVHRLFQHTYENRTYKFGGNFKPSPPETPIVHNSFQAMYFLPHEVVADERPTTTHQTLAIHTLNGMPLQAPHGKKMVAKELGVYYGFHSQPGKNSDTNAVKAGYYDRSGEKRRYLWLDTDIRSNFYSIAQKGHYHDHSLVEWTMAILMAIARKTNRILILPQIFDADMDAGVYFAWTMMDYSKVAEMVDFRETHFLSNPKAWRNGRSSHSVEEWPFETVVNTALFEAENGSNQISIYTQVSNRSSIISNKVLTSSLHDNFWLDAWIGSLSTIPELESAEVLLVNPDLLMDSGRVWRVAQWIRAYLNDVKEKGIDHPDVTKLGSMDKEVAEIYNLLGWCWNQAFRHTANKVSASDSCYGIGNPTG